MATTTVTATYLNPSGNPARGSVTFRLVAATYSDGLDAIFPTVPVRADLDDNGAISVELQPTSGVDADFDSTTMTYEVRERINGADRDPYWVDVPTAPSADLGTLTTYDDPPYSVRQLVTPDLDTLGYLAVTDADLQYRRTGLSAVRTILAAAPSKGAAALQVVGDSTGNETDEWFYLVGAALAADYPAWTVEHRLWDNGTSAYGAPTTIQTGTAGIRYTTFNGTTSNVAIYDAEVTSITGDIDVRIKVALDDWTPAADQVLVAKFGSAGNRSWRMEFGPSFSNRPFFGWTEDGTNQYNHSATAWSAVADGTAVWVRATLDVDNGAGAYVLKFYQSSDGATWVQQGSTITGVETTNLYDGTCEIQVGARGGYTSAGVFLDGNVYEVEVRDGIGGPNVVPQRPELWPLGQHFVTTQGAPVLTMLNASISGAGVDTFTDTVIQQATPDFGQVAAFVSLSHNEVNYTGGPWLTKMTAMLDAMKLRLPAAAIGVCSQNPEIDPATRISQHAVRCGQVLGWALQQGCVPIDVYRAFLESDDALSDLIDAGDGIHPNAAGSTLWRDVVLYQLA